MLNATPMGSRPKSSTLFWQNESFHKSGKDTDAPFKTSAGLLKRQSGHFFLRA